MPRRREFAEDTSVSVPKSKAAIEDLLASHGAEGFQTGWQGSTATDPGWDVIGFLWKGKQIRFRIDRPKAQWVEVDPKDPTKKVTRTAPWAMETRSNWRMKTGNALVAAIDQKNRQRWRLLYLVVKAKLEAVQSGVVVFEEEFMPFIVTASGQTIGEYILPRLAAAGAGLLQLEPGRE